MKNTDAFVKVKYNQYILLAGIVDKRVLILSLYLSIVQPS